jgi:adenosylcobinamide-GDP ribazoletransferase
MTPSLRNPVGFATQWHDERPAGKGIPLIQRDISKIWHGFLSALSLLTRLPLPALPHPQGAEAAWAWPLVGVVIGTLNAVVAAVLLWFHVPVAITAAAVLGANAILTGALHEDGLADTADGFFGGWTRERRLEIMKDSHIGSYGTLALIVTALARWSALAVVLTGPIWALIAVAALSRAPMAAVMAALPNARGRGLAQSVGRPDRDAVAIAMVLAFFVAAVMTGVAAALIMVAVVAVMTGVLALTAQSRIGGQTGDVLGASQQLAEVAALTVLATLI